jgi:GTP-dependent dephospho-CoA kinase
MLRLPRDKRLHFKAPFGVLYPDIRSILHNLAGKTVYTVGDVVTFNLVQSGIVPAIAIIDGQSMREPFIGSPQNFQRCFRARNPSGTLTSELLDVIHTAIEVPDSLIFVEGEEDLAVIPLVLEAPLGAIILYGQPGEGVVLCDVTPMAKQKAREMLSYFIEGVD